MKSLANYMSDLKVLVLAGTMFLMPVSALAQQEVSPDIYGDSSPKMVQNAKPAQQAKKQDARKMDAGSKNRKDSRKKADDRKLAAANSDKNVTLAQAQ